MATASGTQTVTAGATSVVVTGSFSVPYQVSLSTSWMTETFVTGKSATQFTVQFSFGAPVGNGTLDYVATFAAIAGPVLSGATIAVALLNRVRPKIPDLVFLNDQPQSGMDGKFRVQVLLGWLDDAIQVLTQLSGWTLTDWWAMRQVEFQPWYAVPSLFVSMESAFSNQWALNVVDLDEADTVWPNTPGPATSQPLGAYVRSLGSALSVGLWPTPPATDPTTTLTSGISDAGPDPIPVTSTTGFLASGYVQIEDEIVQYQTLTPTGLGVVSRGIGGTAAVSHGNGLGVTSLGFWIKGRRVPLRIVSPLSVIEVPLGWMSHLETYVLAQVRITQKGRAREGESLLRAFEQACAGINADPNWKVNRGQIRAFGDSTYTSPWGGGGVVVP
jgi:hypothetical protein